MSDFQDIESAVWTEDVDPRLEFIFDDAQTQDPCAFFIAFVNVFSLEFVFAIPILINGVNQFKQVQVIGTLISY